LAPGLVFRPDSPAGDRAAVRINVAYGADAHLLEFLKGRIRRHPRL
jgi:hypothetical protein